MPLDHQPVLNWLSKNHTQLVGDLARQVAIRSISTDGDHQKEIDQTAALTCDQMRAAGLQNVEVLRTTGSNPYAYGEWLGAPGKPTVFLYAHHDVQPVNDVGDAKWESDPWTLTARKGRLFGRGSADDKGAITAQLGAVAAFLKTHGKLPVNVKMVVEGEEEVGSANLLGFFQEQKARIQSDVIVVNDTENVEVGLPCITYALRGIVAVQIEVQSGTMPVHSGMAGGALADAAIALNVILARLYWKNGPLPIPGFYDRVRPMNALERKSMAALPGEEAKWRARTRHPRRRSLLDAGRRSHLRTNLAQAGGDGHRAGGEFDQERVESGAAEGDGDRELPYRAGSGSGGSTRAADGLPVGRSAVGREGDGEATGRGEVVDDRPDGTGVRRGTEGTEERFRARGRGDRLRRLDRFRRAAGGTVRRRAGVAARHRGPAEQRPCAKREPTRRRLAEVDEVVDVFICESRRIAGWSGQIESLVSRDAVAERGQSPACPALRYRVAANQRLYLTRPPDFRVSKRASAALAARVCSARGSPSASKRSACLASSVPNCSSNSLARNVRKVSVGYLSSAICSRISLTRRRNSALAGRFGAR